MNLRLPFADCRLRSATRRPWSVVRCSRVPAAILTPIVFLACGSRPTLNTNRILPEAGEAAGWAKTRETRIFPAERLYEYIDGDAEKYARAGVQQTVTSDYRFGQDLDAVVDVFVMSNAAGATTVFDSQPAIGSQPVQLGNAARAYKGSLIFRQGRCFVRLVAFADTPDTAKALATLARAISDKLKKVQSQP